MRIVKGISLCVLFVISLLYEGLAVVLVKINRNLSSVSIENWFSKTILNLKSNWKKKYSTSNKLDWFKKYRKKGAILLFTLLSFIFYRYDDITIVTAQAEWERKIFEELFEREALPSTVAFEYLKNLEMIQNIGLGEEVVEVSTNEVIETFYLKAGVGKANIRSDGSLNSKIIETAYEEQPLINLHQSKEDNDGRTWFYVQLPNGVKGWISSKLLQYE